MGTVAQNRLSVSDQSQSCQSRAYIDWGGRAVTPLASLDSSYLAQSRNDKTGVTIYGFKRGGSDQVFSRLEWKIENEQSRLILLSLTMCSVWYLMEVVERSSEYRASLTRLGTNPLAPISQGTT